MDNRGFHSAKDDDNQSTKTSETRIAIDEATETLDEPCCCCSWSRLCDVMGNRQEQFIVALRPVKLPIISASQRLVTLQIELERGMRTTKSTTRAVDGLHRLIKSINNITTNSELNVPPDENEMLRRCAMDLATVMRVIEQLEREDREELRRQDDVKPARSSSIVFKDGETSPSASPEPEPSFNYKGKNLRNSAAGSSAVDEHSLKERIGRNVEMLEKLLKFVDKKTERRWWLRDVINFAQLLVKLALFISASLSVFYHEEQVFPIITLVLTIGQGVIEVLDQYFLRNKQPEDIKMHVVTTLSASTGSKG